MRGPSKRAGILVTESDRFLPFEWSYTRAGCTKSGRSASKLRTRLFDPFRDIGNRGRPDRTAFAFGNLLLEWGSGPQRSLWSSSAFRGHPGHECVGRVGTNGNAPEIGDVERRPNDPAAVTLSLCKQLIEVVDFKIAQPVRRIGIGSDSTHVEDTGDRLPTRLGEPVGGALVWHRHAFERPADGRGIERFDRLDITRIEFIPDEISVSHNFLHIAEVDRRQRTTRTRNNRRAIRIRFASQTASPNSPRRTAFSHNLDPLQTCDVIGPELLERLRCPKLN
jgi:hypothetical protein